MGEREAGERERGGREAGEREMGEREAGEREMGEREAGEREAGEMVGAKGQVTPERELRPALWPTVGLSGGADFDGARAGGADFRGARGAPLTSGGAGPRMIAEPGTRYLAGGGSGCRGGRLGGGAAVPWQRRTALAEGLSGETGAGGRFTGRRAGRAAPGCRCRVPRGRG